MTTATTIITYLAEGTHAARPAAPNVPTGCIAIYYETDTTNTFLYDPAGATYHQINGGGGGGGLTTTAESASFNAAANNRYLVDTTAAAVTATMPLAPASGDIFAFVDSTGQFATHNLTINWNGKNFQGSASNTVLSINYSMLLVIYNGTQYVQIPA